MTKTTTTCDNCGEVVRGFFLALQCFSAFTLQEISQVHRVPPIDGEKHFCNKYCLENWLKKKE